VTQTSTPKTTRAERLAMPLAREVVRDLAVEHGACIRPVQLRRTDVTTGAVEQVLVPCGHTLAAVCPACAAKASVPVSALEEARMVSKALDACGTKLDGSAAAPQYYRRRRRVFYAALKYAVREKRLSANPLDGTPDREWKAPDVDQAVDRRRVASPAQMRALLDAISSTGRTQGPRLVALYGCMYYGMLRPSEAVSLLRDECHLPDEGWGRLEFREVSSAAGREWTDDGEVHEARKLKGGPRNAVRRVPIPPELVTLLRKHIDQYGTAPDGRLCRTCRGGIYQPSPPLAGATESTFSGVHARSGQFPAGQQALRLPPRRRSPGGSTRALPAPRWPNGPGTASRCSTGSTPTASTATTNDGTSRWKTSSDSHRTLDDDSAARAPPSACLTGLSSFC
jgi:integrase